MNGLIEVTAAIIHREGKVLIARRNEGVRAGLWEFPGGKVEAGESLEACLAREIREELGVEILASQAFAIVEQVYPDIRIRLHTFFCAAEERSLALSAHLEVKWVPPSDLDAFHFSEADRKVVDALQRLTQEGTVYSPQAPSN